MVKFIGCKLNKGFPEMAHHVQGMLFSTQSMAWLQEKIRLSVSHKKLCGVISGNCADTFLLSCHLMKQLLPINTSIFLLLKRRMVSIGKNNSINNINIQMCVFSAVAKSPKDEQYNIFNMRK